MIAAVLVLLVAVASAAPVATVTWPSTVSNKTAVGSIRSLSPGYAPCDPSVVQYSGYFDINEIKDKHYFFWAFESRGNPLTDPVILWMTGGPGCSSELALISENGPCHIHKNGTLYNNVYSWNSVATVIYIDQPSGVGFSYADQNGYDHNETQVSNDMYHFMQAFYKALPKFLKNKLFVYGESYGGHFAPSTAHRIWQGNNNLQPGYVTIPLEGLSVGNGLTEPVVQYNYYAELAYNWCMTVKGQPCISKSDYDAQVAAIPTCIAMIAACNAGNGSCSDAQAYCDNTQMGPYEETGLNVYDIRLPCAAGGLCYDFSASNVFFNLPEVQRALGVLDQNITWTSCNYQVNGMFSNDWMKDFGRYAADLINNNVRVMIYAGDMDFICNWIGNKAWTLSLQWSNATAFAAAIDRPWYVDEVEAGFVRSVSNSKTNALFSFVQIHGAGHLVPMDQPERSLRMVQHFIADIPL